MTDNDRIAKLEARVATLEEGLVALATFTVENDRTRFTRSLAAGAVGSRTLEIIEGIESARSTVSVT
jgi:hypothetical protein